MKNVHKRDIASIIKVNNNNAIINRVFVFEYSSESIIKCILAFSFSSRARSDNLPILVNHSLNLSLNVRADPSTALFVYR